MDNKNSFAAGPQTVVTPSFVPQAVSTPAQSVPEPRREQTVQQMGTNPNSQPYTLEDLESPSTTSLDNSQSTAQANAAASQAPQQTTNQAPTPKSGLLKKILIGAAIIAVVIFLATLGVVFITRNRQAPQESAGDVIPDQQVDLSVGQAKGVFDLAIEGQESKLIVNGSVVSRGDVVLTADDTNAYGQISAQNLNGVYTYLLPNAAGTFCLDSNNCNYLQETDVTATTIAGADGALELGAGLQLNGNTIVSTTANLTETSINNFGGSVSVQGTASQVSVTNSGGVITLSTPQDIDVTSSPTFNSLTVSTTGNFNSITLASEGLQNGNTICDASNNCGYAGGTDAFVQNGNDFGGLAVLGTNSMHNLAFETAGTTRMTIDTDGNVDITKSLELGSVASGAGMCSSVLGTFSCSTIFDTGEVYTDTTTPIYGIYNIVGITPLGTNSGGAVGAENQVYLFGSNNFTSTYSGSRSVAVSATTGSVANLIGADASVLMQFGSATNAYGSRSHISVGGTLTNAYGSYIKSTTNTGTLTNNYGLYIEDQSGHASNDNYNIYSEGDGYNWFQGNTAVGSSAPNNSAVLQVTGTTTGGGYGILNGLNVTAVSGDSSNIAGYNAININGSADYGTNVGLASSTINNSTGTTDNLIGFGVLLENTNTGTINDAVGIRIDTATNDSGGDIINNYGLYVQDQSGVGSSSSYNIYSAGANSQNYLEGYLGINNTTTPNRLSVNTLTTAQPLAQVAIATGLSTNKGLIVQGAASQSATLQEWQNSAGTALSTITSTGSLNLTGVGTNTPLITFGSGADIRYNSAGDTGAYRFNGSTSRGFTAGYSFDLALTYGITVEPWGSGAATALTVRSTAAAGQSAPLMVVRANSNQTGNLQEWQNSSNTVLAAVGATGRLGIGGTVSPEAKLHVKTLSGDGGIPGILSGNSYTVDGAASKALFTNAGWSEYPGIVGIGSRNSSLDIPSIATYGTVGVVGAAGANTGGRTHIGVYGYSYLDQTLSGNSSNSISGGYFKTDLTAAVTDFNGTMYGARGLADSRAGAQTGGSVIGIQGSALGETNNTVIGGNFTAASTGSSIALRAVAGNTGTIGQVIQGAASQVANLSEWHTSTGEVVARISSVGNMTIGANTAGSANQNGSLTLQGWYTGGGGTATSLILSAGGSNPSIIGGSGGNQLIIGSPSGIQFCTSSACSTTLGRFDSSGRLSVGSGNPVGQLSVDVTSAARVGAIIKGAAAQTANLQEWQDSTTAVLALVSATGDLEVKSATVDGDLVVTGEASITGELTVGSVVTGDITINGHIVGNDDTRGVVTLTIGEVEETHTFDAAYDNAPHVVATPTSNPGAHFWVSDITTTGFKVNLGSPAGADIDFNFMVQE